MAAILDNSWGQQQSLFRPIALWLWSVLHRELQVLKGDCTLHSSLQMWRWMCQQCRHMNSYWYHLCIMFQLLIDWFIVLIYWWFQLFHSAHIIYVSCLIDLLSDDWFIVQWLIHWGVFHFSIGCNEPVKTSITPVLGIRFFQYDCTLCVYIYIYIC